MSTTIQPPGSSLSRTLRALAHRPVPLAGLLILLNALFDPYLGIVHDSQLYSGLVLNRLDPSFLSDDLFFRFGSQDKYTLFSPLMAPLVALLGHKPAFFFGYLASMSLMLVALTRLTLKLWPGSPAAVVGLIYLAVVPVAYGGYVPLHVIEPFLSARTPSCALTLLALVDFLDRRWFRCGLAMTAAFAIHPLMAMPGAMGIALVVLSRRWGAWGVAAPTVLSLAALGGILATPSLATRLFGEFDEQWLQLTQQTNLYMFPQEWLPSQWFWNLFALAGLVAAANPHFVLGFRGKSDPSDRSRILLASALIGVVGFFGAWLFTMLPYSLPMKGQAYRWLWLPLALTPPAFLHLAWQAWRLGGMRSAGLPRLMAIGLATFLVINTYHWLEFACLAFFLPVTLFAAFAFTPSKPRLMTFANGVAASFLIGTIVWGLFRIWNFFHTCTAIQNELTPMALHEIVLGNLGGGPTMMALLAILALFGNRLAELRRPWAIPALGFAVQALVFVWMTTDNYRALDPNAEELRFVGDFLKDKKSERGQTLAVYSNYGRLHQTWIEWGARSYYDCFQLAGFVFNRDTAIEGKRRARLVGPFEAASLAKGRAEIMPQEMKDTLSAWLGADVDTARPTEDDLLRLAHEDGVDFIVLFGAHLDRLATARHGDVSIYDCRALRDTRFAKR